MYKTNNLKFDSSTTLPFEITCNYGETDPWNASTLTWTEIEAETKEDWNGLTVSCWNNSTATIVIATGAAGSETVKAMMLSQIVTSHSNSLFIPIFIPKGTRVAFTGLSWTAHTWRGSIFPHVTGADNEVCKYTQLDYGPVNLNGAVSWYGAVTISAPLVADNVTYGAWTEMTKSGANDTNNRINTSFSYDYEMIGLQWSTGTLSGLEHPFITCQFGVGNAGEEVALATIETWQKNNTVSAFGDNIFWIPWNRPAGERLVARYKTDNDVAGINAVSLRLYGLR